MSVPSYPLDGKQLIPHIGSEVRERASDRLVPMARSTYIYALTEDGLILAAFTVKHEMMTWLDNHPGDYDAWRISDGGQGLPSTMDIDHQDTETASAGCRDCGWTASGPMSRQAAIDHSTIYETYHSTRMMSR